MAKQTLGYHGVLEVLPLVVRECRQGLLLWWVLRLLLLLLLVWVVLKHDGDVVVVLAGREVLVRQPQHHLDTVHVTGVAGLAQERGGAGQLAAGEVGEQRLVEGARRTFHHVQDRLEEVRKGAAFGRRLEAEVYAAVETSARPAKTSEERLLKMYPEEELVSSDGSILTNLPYINCFGVITTLFLILN